VDHFFDREVRAGHGVADLRVVQQFARDGADVIQRGVRAAEVQRIDQDAGVGR